MIGSKILAMAACAALVGASSAFAAVTPTGYVAIGTSTAFPTTSVNGAPLVKQTVDGTATGNNSLQGGSSTPAPAGGGIGEIFRGVNGKLTAITFATNGNAGGDTFIPFLYDLGTATYNDGSTQFGLPKTNLLTSTPTLSFGPTGNASFYELDFSGPDVVTLDPTHSYAFGFDNTSNTALTGFKRSAGGSSDPTGEGFTIGSPYSTATFANPSGFAGAGAPRALYIGVYAVVPEPTSLAALGLGGVALIKRRRRA